MNEKEFRIRIIVKNPKNDTYLPCYDANACGLLASIFGCCTIIPNPGRKNAMQEWGINSQWPSLQSARSSFLCLWIIKRGWQKSRVWRERKKIDFCRYYIRQLFIFKAFSLRTIDASPRKPGLRQGERGPLQTSDPEHHPGSRSLSPLEHLGLDRNIELHPHSSLKSSGDRYCNCS